MRRIISRRLLRKRRYCCVRDKSRSITFSSTKGVTGAFMAPRAWHAAADRTKADASGAAVVELDHANHHAGPGAGEDDLIAFR